MDIDLRRLIVRHRHVAPMVSALLAATNARVTISDAAGNVILGREAGDAPREPSQRFPISAEGRAVGWVEGPRPAAAIAAVLSYAYARETDKRSLAQEALERYRELNLIYDLAQSIGATLEVAAVCRVAVAEASRLPGGIGFVLLTERDTASLAPPPGRARSPLGPAPAGEGIVGAVADGEAEIVNHVASDRRASEAERRYAALAAAPLRVRGERIGVIGTLATEPTEFRAGDLKLLSAIAALAAPAIDQSRQHESAVADGSVPAGA